MRVIGGSARSRRLAAPPGRGTRPTSDRVREALFSSLAREVPGATVLDLFAGSGALGIEALSRGAARAVFVERDPRAAGVVAANLASTGLADRAELRRDDAARFVADPRGGPFDVVLVDPPYELAIARTFALLDALRSAGGLKPGALVVIERDRRTREDRALPDWLALERERSYGDTALLMMRVSGESPA